MSNDMEMLNGLALFAGIGGIELALRRWVRTVCYVENDLYAAAVLMSRMRSGDLDEAPIWDDITTFDTRGLAGHVDIVTGGFPCQDISLAGKGAGLAGERSGLFWEITRIVGEIRPRFIFLENVPAIVQRGALEVGGALASMGYDDRGGVLSAFDVGAPQQRERWWCLAHANRGRKLQPQGGQQDQRRWIGNSGETLAGAAQLAKREPTDQDHTVTGSRGARPEPCGRGWWAVEPNVGRVADGVPQRVDRLRCLGNSVVPQCAEEAFRRLMGLGAAQPTAN